MPMTDTLFHIPKDLLAKLHKANSEDTVRQRVIKNIGVTIKRTRIFNYCTFTDF